MSDKAISEIIARLKEITPSLEHHDLQRGELGRAAACLAAPAPVYEKMDLSREVIFADPWPFGRTSKKVCTTTDIKRSHPERRKQLVLAAAYLLAEIQRIEELKQGDSAPEVSS